MVIGSCEDTDLKDGTERRASLGLLANVEAMRIKQVLIGVLCAVLSIAAIWFMIAVTNEDVKNNEVAECKQWAEQAGQFQGFYILQWQADQCVARGITVNAPIR